jgi:hypothetical protein
MRRNPIRDLCFLAIVFALAFSLGCSRPFTDIVATNSEDVGPWDVSNAHANGRQLTADVCLHEIDSAAAVSDRLLFQLQNKGYDRIQLAMYATSGGQTERDQVSWSAETGKQMQGAAATSENPCAVQQAHAEVEAGEGTAERRGERRASPEHESAGGDAH